MNNDKRPTTPNMNTIFIIVYSSKWFALGVNNWKEIIT